MIRPLQSYAVFCGSSSGKDPIYIDNAYETGKLIASRGARVIYGGAQVGLMGAVADGALHAGGSVVGVIPGFLKTKEIAHEWLSELIVVETMHERKLKMHELSDAIIGLPGGWGTMEELTEMLTWAQLGLHLKPIGLLNTNGFYDGLIQQIAVMQEHGFLRPEYAAMLIVRDNLDDLLSAMNEYVAPAVPKWINEERT